MKAKQFLIVKRFLSHICYICPLGVSVLPNDIKVTMMSKQLNGSQRVLLDGVITDDECRELQRLSNVSYLKRGVIQKLLS